MKPKPDEDPKVTSTQLCQKVNPLIDFLIFLVMEMEDDHAFFLSVPYIVGRATAFIFPFRCRLGAPLLGQLATPGFVMRRS